MISTLDIHGWGAPTAAADIALGNLRVLADAGAGVLYGTDLGNGPMPLGVNHRELRLLVDAGLSPDEVRAATRSTSAPPALQRALLALPALSEESA